MSATQSSIWIRNPIFDLAFVMGGALFTLVIAALTFALPQWLPVFFWVWVVAFEGSHFWATISRTYLDTKFCRENFRVLYGSLFFFLFPLAAILLENSSVVSYTLLYGFFIFVWSLYHNARQHFGFLSIYCKKAGVNEMQKKQLVRVLYLAIVAPQLFFLLNFKAILAFGLSTSHLNPSLQFLISDMPKLVSFGVVVYLLYQAVALWKVRGAAGSAVIVFIVTCLVFYTTMFYGIAPIDHFVQNGNGVETLMLIAIMNSLFHNIQYHAIVWHYGQSRYAQSLEGFGLARFVNGKSTNYFSIALLIGVLFGVIVWHVGDWPGVTGSYEGIRFHSWAYVLFFGIIGHHFFLDQFIWRPSRQIDLRQYLFEKK